MASPAHARESLQTKTQSEADACSVFVYDQEKVNRLRRRVEGIEEAAALFKALADETRVKIVYALTREDELCVCDVAGIIGSSSATASYHLRLLDAMRLAKRRRRGKMVFYSLLDDHVRQLVDVALAHIRETDDPQGDPQNDLFDDPKESGRDRS